MKTLKIYGPPGTGKTSFLMELFNEELKRTRPDRIAFLTFTREARAQALNRSGLTQTELPYLRTIHSICYRQLGIGQQQIMKVNDIADFGKKIGVKLTGASGDPWTGTFVPSPPTKDDALLQINHLGRHRGIQLKKALDGARLDIEFRYAKWFTEAYRLYKNQEAMYDYTDLLTGYLERGTSLPIDVLFVDEAQDLSALQWKVVHLLGSEAFRVYIAGDDDQAIFTWAGASAELFNSQPADEINILKKSHRLPEQILQVSQSIIKRVRQRTSKEVDARGEGGIFQEVGFLGDEVLTSEDALILFRNHHRGLAIGQKLIDLGQPFRSDNSPLSNPKTHKALKGWKGLIAGEEILSREMQAIAQLSDEATGWLISNGFRTRPHSDQNKYVWQQFLKHKPTEENWFNCMHRMPMKMYVERVIKFHGWDKAINPPNRLVSIHQSKGGEADTVVLDVEMARKTFDAACQNPEDEHRCWYVAVTRAKNKLLVLLPEGSMYYHL